MSKKKKKVSTRPIKKVSVGFNLSSNSPQDFESQFSNILRCLSLNVDFQNRVGLTSKTSPRARRVVEVSDVEGIRNFIVNLSLLLKNSPTVYTHKYCKISKTKFVFLVAGFQKLSGGIDHSIYCGNFYYWVSFTLDSTLLKGEFNFEGDLLKENPQILNGLLLEGLLLYFCKEISREEYSRMIK